MSYFSYKVTLPLLNCVEISDQNMLLSLFPILYTDLKNGDLTTLKEFVVEYRHAKVQPLQTEVAEKEKYVNQ